MLDIFIQEGKKTIMKKRNNEVINLRKIIVALQQNPGIMAGTGERSVAFFQVVSRWNLPRYINRINPDALRWRVLRLREMWRKKLKLCAVLSVLMATLWLWQGYQGAFHDRIIRWFMGSTLKTFRTDIAQLGSQTIGFGETADQYC